jgi:hypothetical protein
MDTAAGVLVPDESGNSNQTSVSHQSGETEFAHRRRHWNSSTPARSPEAELKPRGASRRKDWNLSTRSEGAKMTDSSSKATVREFQNGQPYTNIAGELVANCIVLMEAVRERRPEIKSLGGTLHVTLDSEHGVILVGLAHEDGQVVLIERILANPHEPATFGKSELPLKVQQQKMH